MAWASHPDALEILKVPGYLFWNPTALDVEAHWGTKLGFSENGINFEPSIKIAELTTPESGPEPRMMIYIGGYPRISCILQNYNTTLLSRLFPGMITGTTVKFPGTVKMGTNIMTATYSKPVLFVPDDQANNPACLLQLATPKVTENMKWLFSHRKRALFPVVFVAGRKDANVDGCYTIGPLSGLTLR